MAKRKKDLRRWKVECPRCGRNCPAVVTKRTIKKATLSFECHGCGESADVVITGGEARKFK